VSHVGSIFSLPYESNTFGGALVSNILEPLDQAELGFQEAARVVKQEGVIVITCPFEAGFRHDPTHVRFF
jgi:ubiquinone/menaquinone biosynthesis C-methylase UbiE